VKTGMMSTSRLKQLLDEQQVETPIHAIVRALGGEGSMSAAALCRATNLAKSTVSVALADLKNSGIVVDSVIRERNNGKAGRPAREVQLNPNAGTCVGIHLELEGLRLCVADVSHSIIDELYIPIHQDYAPFQGLTAARAGIEKLYKSNSLARSHLLGIGISISSPVTPEGVIHKASILPSWAGVNAKELFSNELNAPIFTDNESNCAAIAELMWGSAANEKDFVLLKIDLGVGGAIVSNGSVIRGIAGGAGEFGHMMIDPHGALCRCGNRGCLELTASFREPVQQMSAILGRPSSIDEIILMAERGDMGARRLVSNCGQAAGRGLAAICAVLNPPIIIVSGRGALAGEMLIGPLKFEFENHALIKSAELAAENRTVIKMGKFTHNDSLLGAVGLVLRSLSSSLSPQLILNSP